MIDKPQVVDLAVLPRPVKPQVARGLEGVEARRMMVLLDPKDPTAIFKHPVFGALLGGMRDQFLVAGKEEGKFELRHDPFPLALPKGALGNIEVIYLKTGGKLEGSPDVDSYVDVAQTWRDATALGIRTALDLAAREKDGSLAIGFGEEIPADDRGLFAMRQIGRAAGNVGAETRFYKSARGDRYVDGVKQAADPTGTVTGLRNGVEMVYLIPPTVNDDVAALLETAFQEGDDISRMQLLTRFLAEAPHNKLDCKTFVEVMIELNNIARRMGANMEIEIYGPENAGLNSMVDLRGRQFIKVKSLHALDLNGLEAVHRGSTNDVGPFMVRVTYRHPKAKKEPVNMAVFKGVMQDDGGHCAKGAAAVHMEADMMAAANGAALVAQFGEKQPIMNVDFVFGVVSNTSDGDAYKVNDVIRLSSGVTVEVLNTDAEGRLVLVDTGAANLRLLAQAGEKQGEVMTMATLTGHAVVVAGNRPTVISMNPELRAWFESEGRANGEAFQPLTLERMDFDAVTGGTHADTKNIAMWPVGTVQARGCETGGAFTFQAMGLSDEAKQRAVHIDIAPQLEAKGAPEDQKGWKYNAGGSLATLYNFLTRKALSKDQVPVKKKSKLQG